MGRKRSLVVGLLVAVGLVSTPSRASAQFSNTPIVVSAQDAGSCATANACATFAMGDAAAASFDVDGTFTGLTLNFDMQAFPGGTWRTLTVTNVATGALVTATAAGGTFAVANVGIYQVRVRASALASGSASIVQRRGYLVTRLNGVAIGGLATTSTDGLALTNPTAATSGVPVQMSPRLKWCGAAYNSVSTLSETDCAIVEVLPITNAGTTLSKWQVSFSQNGGAYTNQAYVQSNGSWVMGQITSDSAGSVAGLTGLGMTGALQFSGKTLLTSVAPTVTSAGTSPSVVSNGSLNFRVNVGTGGTATTIVMAMPTATTGWNCTAQNITANAANRADGRMAFQSSTTTAVTMQYQTASTGAAKAFTASDIVAFICAAY